MLDVRTATDSGFEVRMIEDRDADCQLPLEQHRQPNVLLCALRAKIGVVRIGVPNGGSWASSGARLNGCPRRTATSWATLLQPNCAENSPEITELSSRTQYTVTPRRCRTDSTGPA
jgi:hypothetical protein